MLFERLPFQHAFRRKVVPLMGVLLALSVVGGLCAAARSSGGCLSRGLWTLTGVVIMFFLLGFCTGLLRL
jgi:hypothetical protein